MPVYSKYLVWRQNRVVECCTVILTASVCFDSGPCISERAVSWTFRCNTWLLNGGLDGFANLHMRSFEVLKRVSLIGVMLRFPRFTSYRNRNFSAGSITRRHFAYPEVLSDGHSRCLLEVWNRIYSGCIISMVGWEKLSETQGPSSRRVNHLTKTRHQS